MIIVVNGSNKFNDYSIFLNAMGTAMNRMDEEDRAIFLYTAGPRRVNEMATEFSNVSERGLKARGIKIQVRKVPQTWILEYFSDIDYFAYFALPKEPIPSIVDSAEAKEVTVEIYRY
jgi:hypothetical protein